MGQNSLVYCSHKRFLLAIVVLQTFIYVLYIFVYIIDINFYIYSHYIVYIYCGYNLMTIVRLQTFMYLYMCLCTIFYNGKTHIHCQRDWRLLT